MDISSAAASTNNIYTMMSFSIKVQWCCIYKWWLLDIISIYDDYNTFYCLLHIISIHDASNTFYCLLYITSIHGELNEFNWIWYYLWFKQMIKIR